jgi:hypothetical protein
VGGNVTVYVCREAVEFVFFVVALLANIKGSQRERWEMWGYVIAMNGKVQGDLQSKPRLATIPANCNSNKISKETLEVVEENLIVPQFICTI